MKYTGNITILDEAGNIVFDRELTPDQIIETLLIPAPSVSEEDIDASIAQLPAEAPTLRKYKKRAGGGRPPKKKSHGCSVCGKPGHNAKTCGKERPAGVGNGEHKSSPNARTIKGRKPFSQGTFFSVKNRLEGGDPIDQVVGELGLDEGEVRRVNLADTFEDYLTVA